MKANHHLHDAYSCSTCAEAIAWISGIIVFILIFSGWHLQAQDSKLNETDTIWLKTGEIVPCIMLNDFSQASRIQVVYTDDKGSVIREDYPFSKVARFKKTSTEEDLKQLPNESYAPKYVKIYVGMGLGLPTNAGISANVLFPNNMGGSLSVKTFSVKSKNLPSDYRGGIFSAFGNPVDKLNVFSACFVLVYPTNTKLLRLGVEAGPALVNYTEIEYYPVSSTFFGPNYGSRTNTQQSLGLTLRGKIEFPLSQGFGFEFAVLTNVNKYRSILGFECYISFGRIRDRRQPRK